MDLRQLEYFQVVGKVKSITKAAQQFHIAQPSVSVAIQKLEEELGVQLLDRGQRQIDLTVEGKIFLGRVDEILGKLAESIKEMHDYRLLQKGSIKIGVTPIVGAFFFPLLFAEFAREFPQFELHFVEEGSLSIRRRLEQGELDIGIMILSNAPPELSSVPVASGEILLCLPLDHPLSQAKQVPFSELAKYPFILFREDTYFRKVIMEEAAKHHFTPRIVFASRQIETVLGLVEQGVGISFVLDAIAAKHGNIVTRKLSEPLYIEAGVAWYEGRYLSKAAKAFIDFAASRSF
ncbi:MAG: LysR family transcriptional regulator [Sporomusaceae bacterium]|nr:LysR family transcriptional regulator [Sporomusaceae bacterium]